LAQNLKSATANLKKVLEGLGLNVFLGRAAGPLIDRPEPEDLPAAMIEFGRLPLANLAQGESEISVLGAARVAVRQYLVIGILFKEPDAATAWNTRCQFEEDLVRALVRNKTLGGAVGALYPGASRWEYTAPSVYMLLREVTLEYTLEP
jgi:hypothetical protein